MIQNTEKLNAALTTGPSPSTLADLFRDERVDVTAPTPSRIPAADTPPVAPARHPVRRPGRSPNKVRITFEVWDEFAPALRSAIEEISNDIGARLTGTHRFAKEQALTDAAIALAALRVAISQKVPDSDPNYV